MVGAIVLDMALLVGLLTALYYPFQAAGGVKGVFDLLQHVITFDLLQ